MRSWSRFIHTMFRPRTPNPRRRTISSSRSWSRAGACHAIESLETRELLAATPVAGAWTGGAFDQVGLFEDGVWQLDLDGDFFVGDDSPPFQFGRAGDLPVTGDWNGDGVHSVGVFRDGRFIIDRNDDRIFTAGTDLIIRFGNPGDIPLIGNWNGRGPDDLGVVRNARFLLDTSANGRLESRDANFVAGLRTDTPVAGNWDPSDRRDSIGLFRNGTWFIDSNENFIILRGQDAIFAFGAGNSDPFTGDFAGNNTDEVGIVTANGTPFVRAVPPPPGGAAASQPLAASTADSTERTALATTANSPSDDGVVIQDAGDDEEKIETLFTRENFQELEHFTLTGMAPRR